MQPEIESGPSAYHVACLCFTLSVTGRQDDDFLMLLSKHLKGKLMTAHPSLGLLFFWINFRFHFVIFFPTIFHPISYLPLLIDKYSTHFHFFSLSPISTRSFSYLDINNFIFLPLLSIHFHFIPLLSHSFLCYIRSVRPKRIDSSSTMFCTLIYAQ